jgi:CheY-like chemotaxis protein
MRADGPVNILAVDDTPGKLLALATVLGELGQNVVTAQSGREALRLLLQQEFAVILLDVHMPGMDGFEAASLIRQRQSSEHTPIIFVTSYPDDTHAARGYSLGAVDYILAPVDPEVLKTKVMVFVELFRKTAQVRTQAQALEHRAAQLHRLTQASLVINSALSLDQMLQVVSDLARDILNVHQAVAVAAPDQKWSAPRTAVSLSPDRHEIGERPVLRDRAALLGLLSFTHGPLRFPAAGAPSGCERYLAKDGPARLGWLAAPLTGSDGRNMGLLHLLEKRDGDFTAEDESILTQLAQMSSIAIENAVNAEAREANRMKDEFLTTLSHELRTPLSAILGWTRLLRAERRGSRRVMEGLEVIERNVMAQTKLIEDLLDVSRIITGKLRLQVQPTALSEIIVAAMESMRPAADGKEIEMRFVNHLPESGDRIIGDPDRLQQVIWNLISNSIKFTPARGRVEVTLARRGGEYEVAVNDTGRGMTTEFLEHAFDRFRQADSSTTRAHGGLGIGLAIARHLTELHGGSIGAESAGPGLGSRFTVRLPSVALGLEPTERRGHGRAPAVRSAAPKPADLSGLRILLVEDQWDSRELMAEILRRAGCAVTAVGSAPEAMEALAAERPDVVVSDIGMPGEDGYSLVRRIRRESDGPRGPVPAIAVSAYAREEDRIRSLSAGFQVHLAKPFEPLELIAAVDRLARRASAASVPPEPPEPRAEAPAPSVLVIEDNADLREGLRQLLGEWGHGVELAENGLSGIERAIEARPRVALVDIGLPDVDGYEVARRIRSLLDPGELFLVALTGHVGPEDLQQALDSGFDAHIPKPIPYEKLRALLAERLEPSPPLRSGPAP